MQQRRTKMNKVILIGRLCKDHDIRQTQEGTMVLSNTIAVSRDYKNANGEYGTDFINFVSWKASAELIAKYFKKGDRIGLVGKWQTRTYQAQDGTNRYVNELMVENIEFLQEKREPAQPQAQQDKNPFANAETKFEIDDDDLPF